MKISQNTSRISAGPWKTQGDNPKIKQRKVKAAVAGFSDTIFESRR